jgi:hypothetical protein
VLLRGQPYLDELAWMRAARGRTGPTAWWAGSTPWRRRRSAADRQSAVAPTHAWDALVCTSPSVRDNVEAMLAGWGEHLAERTGGRPPPHPRLPVIPLGSTRERWPRWPTARSPRPRPRTVRPRRGRRAGALGRAARYYEKAFPQPMFKAVAQAQAATGAKVAFVLAGWFPDAADRGYLRTGRRAMRRRARSISSTATTRPRSASCGPRATSSCRWSTTSRRPSASRRWRRWRAGLPVVGSDWDGYRATVRDGVEGFLIPTLLGGAAGGLGAG